MVQQKIKLIANVHKNGICELFWPSSLVKAYYGNTVLAAIICTQNENFKQST